MKKEYDFSKGVRGKYAGRVNAKSKVIVKKRRGKGAFKALAKRVEGLVALVSSQQGLLDRMITARTDDRAAIDELRGKFDGARNALGESQRACEELIGLSKVHNAEINKLKASLQEEPLGLRVAKADLQAAHETMRACHDKLSARLAELQKNHADYTAESIYMRRQLLILEARITNKPAPVMDPSMVPEPQFGSAEYVYKANDLVRVRGEYDVLNYIYINLPTLNPSWCSVDTKPLQEAVRKRMAVLILMIHSIERTLKVSPSEQP